jgi:hypothetical protein
MMVAAYYQCCLCASILKPSNSPIGPVTCQVLSSLEILQASSFSLKKACPKIDQETS